MSLSDHMFSDATRQAWRDNYNGGRAAGDFAGVYSNPGGSRDYSVSSGQTAGDGNDRSDGSATFSRVVQAGGSAPVAVASGGGSGRVLGPGSPAAGAPRGGGSRSGSALVISGDAPLEVGYKDSATGIYTGGDWWQSNPWWSDTEEWEARYGEPGDWLGGATLMGVDTAFNVARAVDHVTGSNIVTPGPPSGIDWAEIEDGPGAWGAISSAFAREDDRISGAIADFFGMSYSPDPSRY